ncbi:Eukaryotic rRNA processing protein EBP2 [Rhizoctonia solani]|uniref:Eukaryotic rRNA processing protein EBP2 n=1 Tax=Rhizoctonia solani TaxID=456999 RepID=A0A8H7M4S3_9AGAM|nr:Eukaryotic rRNA processing protein EBP2 [Rhizoctonia solani]
MARTAQNLKAPSKPSKPKGKLSETSKPPPPPVVEAPTSTGVEADAESSDEDSEDSEDDGVDEEGMNRLMKLLEQDGLDDIAEHQLSELGIGDNSEEEESQDEEDSEEESEEGEDILDDGDGASESGWLNPTTQEESEDEEDGEETEDVVALDEASEVDEDVVPKQKIVINNEVALKRIRETIELGKDMPCLHFKQALDTANTARAKFAAAKLPFSRPSDYFAEMVKSDSHMERIRQRLLDERAGIQKSETAKKQRELKKIGKQVQVEKLKEREKGKKELNERVKGLKRKRGGALDATDGEAFDVAVEDAIADRPAKRARRAESQYDESKTGCQIWIWRRRYQRSTRETKYQAKHREL